MSRKRLAAVGAVIIFLSSLALGAAWFVSAWTWRPRYDVADPDYPPFAAEFARLEATFDKRPPNARDGLDLVQLNGGRWRTACFFGGYEDPLGTMERIGGRITPADRKRMLEADGGFRMAPVEEGEAVIGYVDLQGDAHFIHFARGPGAETQHFQQCIRKPDTIIWLRR